MSRSRSTGDSDEGPEPIPWDARIFALIDPGIDPASIKENLRRTPAERLARLQQMLLFLEQAKRDEHPETS